MNQGTARPEAFVAFGTLVEQQWKTLVFPTFKASTQHGYQAVLKVHVLPAWRDQFRHIHSSLLNDPRVPVKIAQEQLGHASISTTLNIYTHVVDASHRKAIEDVEDRLFGGVARTGPKLATELKDAPLASTSVNWF